MAAPLRTVHSTHRTFSNNNTTVVFFFEIGQQNTKIMELYWKSIDLALCDIKLIESIQATTATLSHTKRIQWTTHKKIVFLTHCVWNMYSITILQWWDYNNIQHIESMKRKQEKSIEWREREKETSNFVFFRNKFQILTVFWISMF